jgi:hypothetical protein
MTVTEIKTNIRNNLEDAGAVYYDETTLLDEIQTAYARFAYATGYITKAKLFPNLAQPYWYLKQYIPDFLYLNGVYDYDRSNWLVPTDRVYMKNIYAEWETWNGSPNYVIPVDFDRIAVAPHLSSTLGQCLIMYCASAEPLTDTSTPELPICSQHLLEYYVTARLLGHLKEFGKATDYWQLWSDSLRKARIYTSNVAKAEQLRVMSPYMAMPLYVKGSTMAGFIDDETPSGTINGTNAAFTLSGTPSPTDSLCLYKNGQLLFEGIGYILSGNTVTYQTGYVPATGDVHRAWYRIS